MTITIEQFDGNKIKIFGRDPETRERYVETDWEFRPYCYISEKEIDEVSDKDYVTDIEKGFDGIFGENLAKVTVDNTYNVNHLKKNVETTWESSVKYPVRYMVDNLENPIEKEPLRVNVIDIEVEPQSLDVDNAPEPIVIITCYDNFLEKYVSFELGDEKQTIEEDDDWTVYQFDDEAEMLKKFIEFIQDTDPDILTGWNSRDYDWVYIINRMEGFDIDTDQLSPMGKTKINKRTYSSNTYYDVIIKGRTVFDAMEADKDMLHNQRSSQALENVVDDELDDEQKTSPEEDGMRYYNKNDVEITWKLIQYMDYVNFYDSVRRFVGTTWHGLTSSTTSKVDPLFLRKAQERGIILPSKGKHDAKDFQGAFKSEPETGVHEGVFTLDIKSQYPFSVLQFNISPEMIDEDADVQIPYMMREDDNIDAMNIRDMLQNQDEFWGDSVGFKQEEKGMIPSMMQPLYDKRNEYKQKMIDAPADSQEENRWYNMQYAVKVVMNATTMMSGNKYFRLYDQRVAGAVAGSARAMSMWTYMVAQEEGFNVIYTDTDSVIVSLDKEINNREDIEEAAEKAQELNDKINESYDEFAQYFGCDENEYIEIEFESVYSKLFITSKKNKYAGFEVYDEGTFIEDPHMKIKGWEAIRADFPDYGSKVQQEVFDMIMDGKGRDEVVEYVRDMCREIKEADLDDIAIPVSIKRPIEDYQSPTKAVKAAKWSNAYLDTNYGNDSNFKMLFVNEVNDEGMKNPRDNVIGYTEKEELPKDFEVNYKKMRERIIVNKVNAIFQELGWQTLNNENLFSSLDQWF